MMRQRIRIITAIISSEEELERAICQLLAESVTRSDISVQGSPEALKKKYGISHLPPEDIMNAKNPPTAEAYLIDDYGWKIGFSFAIPFFICLVVSILLSDIQSTAELIFYGGIGILVGFTLGFLNAKRISTKYQYAMRLQEAEGGFVIWVTTHSQEQYKKVQAILRAHHSRS